MEGEDLRDGKARVRRVLIDPLVDRGMVRKRGVTVEDHDRFLDGLAARLAYMSEANLSALSEVVVIYAEGPKKNQWPVDVSICNWARRLQEPPASVSRLVRTYLQSGAGRAAKEGGYLVELFFYLKKHGAPPNAYSLSEIRRKGEDNASRRRLIRERKGRGTARQSDLDWLQFYLETRTRVLDIINASAGVAA